MVWYGVVWYDVVYGMVWCMVWYGVVWYGMMWCGINLLLASFAQSVVQVMDRVFSFLLWPKRKALGP